MITKYTLLLDCSNFFYRTMFSGKRYIENFNLKSIDTQKKIINKFVIDIVSLSKLFSYSNLYFVFDGNNIFRKNIDVNYKNNRAEKEEGLRECIAQIYNLVKFQGFNAVKVEGLEADDCITLLVEKFSDKHKIIITADKDLQTLCDDYTFVLNPVGEKTIYQSLYNRDQQIKFPFLIKTIDSFLLLVEKVLKGCESDNVPKIVPKGFGYKKIKEVANFILNQLTLELDDLPQLFVKALKQHNIIIEKEIVEKQLKMVCLLSCFFPTNLIEKFNKVELKPTNKLITISNLLNNTSYYN